MNNRRKLVIALGASAFAGLTLMPSGHSHLLSRTSLEIKPLRFR
jgi:hypothetical protein